MTEELRPCPFCGGMPEVYPKKPDIEGDAWGKVRCETANCVARPIVYDGETVSDDRGSDAYKAAAVSRWNKRVPYPTIFEDE